MAKGSVSHGSELGPWDLEEVCLTRPEVSWGGLRGDELLQVGWGVTMEARHW